MPRFSVVPISVRTFGTQVQLTDVAAALNDPRLIGPHDRLVSCVPDGLPPTAGMHTFIVTIEHVQSFPASQFIGFNRSHRSEEEPPKETEQS